MLHDPTARPTIRVLKELADNGLDAFQARAVKEARWNDIQPLTALAHPLLSKCRSELGCSAQTSGRLIAGSGTLRLAEVRHSQWRVGVWTSDDGVRWVVAAGLAKGGHLDYDDFYEVLARQCGSKEGRDLLLPTEADTRLLKRETAARVLTEWELEIQTLTAHLLDLATSGKRAHDAVPHPLKPEAFAEVDLEVVATDGVEEIVLTLRFIDHPGSHLASVLERRLLISIAPPEQDWDTAFGTYAAMEEVGHCASRAVQLRTATAEGMLLESVPGQVAHRSHRRHIGDAAVEGTAVRALCGAFFVPRTDPLTLPCCEDCESRYRQLPAPSVQEGPPGRTTAQF